MKTPRFHQPKQIEQVAVLALFAIVCAIGSQGQQYRVLHRFTNGADGAFPSATPVSDKAGNVYGVTTRGGGKHACGTIYQTKPMGKGMWTETVLHAFLQNPDCVLPNSLLIDGKGNLFGTTTYGGVYGLGSVFELSPPSKQGDKWKETDIYSFTSENGGAILPTGLTMSPSGSLYGFTDQGGKGTDNGAVFQLTPPTQKGGQWTYNELIDFPVGVSLPTSSPVLDGNGNLFGETIEGRGETKNCNNGCGTIFELVPPNGGSGWTYNQIYAFQGGSDGAYPDGGLIVDKSGNLYGEASYVPVVFELSSNGSGWTETVIYSFTGYFPDGGLVLDAAGNLYGTSRSGGVHNHGFVFKLAPGNPWTESSLHDFGGNGDGRYPETGLLLKKFGTLYGTTIYGGTNQKCGVQYETGCGMVFSVHP